MIYRLQILKLETKKNSVFLSFCLDKGQMMTGARWTALLASSYQLIRHQIQEFDQTPTLQNFFAAVIYGFS